MLAEPRNRHPELPDHWRKTVGAAALRAVNENLGRATCAAARGPGGAARRSRRRDDRRTGSAARCERTRDARTAATNPPRPRPYATAHRTLTSSDDFSAPTGSGSKAPEYAAVRGDSLDRPSKNEVPSRSHDDGGSDEDGVRGALVTSREAEGGARRTRPGSYGAWGRRHRGDGPRGSGTGPRQPSAPRHS